MKKVYIDEAIGSPLAHDICKVTSTSKEVKFNRGHVIQESDKEEFLNLGKEHFYILETGDENLVHEEDAARILALKCNNGDFYESEVSLGKISLLAKKDGYFKVNKEDLINLNMLGDISAACIDNYTYVKSGDVVCSMRIIPLYTTQEKIDSINNLSFTNEIFKVEEIKIHKVGLITTGNEIFKGKIQDKMKPKIDSILSEFSLSISSQTIVQDNKTQITSTLKEHLEQDYDLILLSGGMSVDPDDLTPGAIKESGVDIITYGSPIIPGSMILLGYYKDKTILGVPGGVIFDNKTAFDLLLPKVLLKEKYTKEEIMSMCVGGLL